MHSSTGRTVSYAKLGPSHHASGCREQTPGLVRNQYQIQQTVVLFARSLGVETGLASHSISLRIRLPLLRLCFSHGGLFLSFFLFLEHDPNCRHRQYPQQ